MPLIKHVVLPGMVIGQEESRARETVASFLRRTGWSTTFLPTICVINGEPVLRENWKRRIRKTDVVEFQSRPRGGGSGSSSTKSIIGLVGLIALSALAPGVGTAIAGAIPALAGLSGAVSGAFLAGGAFLLSTFLSPKGQSNTSDVTETVYQFGSQSNSARPLQTIPVQYGRVKKIPDYAAVPWAEFVGDDQYLNMILVRGCGRYQPEQVLVDDTILWTAEDGVAEGFEGVTFQWCEPGEEVTLFPINVAASVEVSGQELADDAVWIGGFIANAAGTTATALALDFALPQGLFIRNSNGTLGQFGCSVIAQYRPVNSIGVATGPWVELFNEVRFSSSAKPQRFSVKTTVAPGRYEVRCRRGVPEGSYANAVDQCLWLGLRSYLTGPQSFENVSVLAMRMKATAQLTQASSSRIGLIETRILPVFNGTEWVEEPTRLSGWAFLDAATNTAYGCKRPLSKVDVQAAVDFATKNQARGDFFDYTFTDSQPATDALDIILNAGRAKHRWLGDVISLVRDEWQALPSMMLTDREIVRNSFSVDYLLQADDSPDCVVIDYVDQDTWRTEQVQIPEDSDALRPLNIPLPGVVQRDQVFREGSFLWRQNSFRRIRPSLRTEHDGRLLSVGSVITVQSELPMIWGQSGGVAHHSGVNLVLEPAPTWEDAGQHYVMLRARDGTPFGPVKVERGDTDADAILDADDLALVETQQDADLEDVLNRPAGSDLPTFALDVGTSWIKRAVVLSGSPDGDYVSLDLAVDFEEVHDDSGTPSPVPPAATLSIPKNPMVSGLQAKLEQNVLEPVLSASWWPSSGALYYIAQISYDGRTTWQPLAQVYSPVLSVVVDPSALSLRVAAVGAGQGAWSVVDLEAPTIDAGAIKVDTTNVTGSLAEALRQIGEVNSQFNSALDEANLFASAGIAAVALAQGEIAQRVQTLPGEVRADVSSRINIATGPDSALATRIDSVVATTQNVAASVVEETIARASADAALTTTVTSHESRLGTAEGTLSTHTSQITTLSSTTAALTTFTSDLNASLISQSAYIAANVNMKLTAAATPAGAVSAAQIQTIADGRLSGIYIVSTTTDAYVAIDTEKFLLRAAGGDPFAVFDVVGGSIFLKGDLIATGSIVASKLAVSTLSSISANVGTLTAGTIVGGSGIMTINVDDGYILIVSNP